jgi:hypothetical protein
MLRASRRSGKSIHVAIVERKSATVTGVVHGANERTVSA